MDFKQFLFLEKELLNKLDTDTDSFLSEQEVYNINPVTLAYIGDVCFSSYVRQRAIATGIHHVKILHNFCSKMVSAVIQSKILLKLEVFLLPRELEVARRGRNSTSQVPKNVSVGDYRRSTALEALLGYLVLSDQKKRLKDILAKSFTIALEEWEK